MNSVMLSFEAALQSFQTKGKEMLIVWFHFLGGSGADWEQSLKSHLNDQLPSVEWFFPNAPYRPVTNYDGKVASCWFDQLEGQVSEDMATPGLDDSVAWVHSLLRKADALGVPASRIILGGMSQGGVLALHAGLAYECPLAGIVAVSAWVPSGLHSKIRHPCTPLFLGSGDADEVVPVDVFKRGHQVLQMAGCSRIITKLYLGLTHTFEARERKDIKNFISSLSQPGVPARCATPARAFMSPPAAMMNARSHSVLPPRTAPASISSNRRLRSRSDFC
jgi:phospholipase/carboxylesterase